eukprot:scaffold13691_cov156-Amphora_coffeaeformis.AAC.5
MSAFVCVTVIGLMAVSTLEHLLGMTVVFVTVMTGSQSSVAVVILLCDFHQDQRILQDAERVPCDKIQCQFHPRVYPKCVHQQKKGPHRDIVRGDGVPSFLGLGLILGPKEGGGPRHH